MSALGDRLGSHRRAFLGSLLPIALAALQYLLAQLHRQAQLELAATDKPIEFLGRRWTPPLGELREHLRIDGEIPRSLGKLEDPWEQLGGSTRSVLIVFSPSGSRPAISLSEDSSHSTSGSGRSGTAEMLDK